MVNGTHRCCNKGASEPCDEKYKCCNLLVSDINDNINKVDFNQYCGVKCTKCNMKKFYKLLSKFEENGCGYKCNNERCNKFCSVKEYNSGNDNIDGCIEERYHILMKEESVNLITKSISNKVCWKYWKIWTYKFIYFGSDVIENKLFK